MKFFHHPERASFLSRPNRFTVVCNLKGKIVKAFLPNPGRLWELLLPDVPVYLEAAGSPNRSLPYTAVAVERDGHTVALHTIRTNQVARYLLEEGAVEGLQGYRISRNEVTIGRSRFDFLLKQGPKALILEVKSCTLFSERVAMFPDAVTERGKRHVEELAHLSSGNTRAAVLFLIHWPRAKVFMPDFHTDLAFARTLLAAKDKVAFFPVAVEWGRDFSIAPTKAKTLPVMWEAVEREAQDRGAYMMILRLPGKRGIRPGALGNISLREGYYIYVGSALKNLSKRIERHLRLRKRLFWHIDYLRAVSEVRAALPIRTEDDLECELARDLGDIAEWSVPGFGSSDCACPSHLFGFSKDPLTTRRFHALLQHFRMERLLDKYHLGLEIKAPQKDPKK